MGINMLCDMVSVVPNIRSLFKSLHNVKTSLGFNALSNPSNEQKILGNQVVIIYLLGIVNLRAGLGRLRMSTMTKPLWRNDERDTRGQTSMVRN